ncbi:AEC family transporter [Pseudovibrio exalbescens]|uniref:AEC family transporter n=1 Tax=Pseudovibrio exalbescens TaxID=197461 RepID=UPI002365A44B|nr:AEC family transporter [Pseudovibrio exalbescens]MDD7908360.1 AEC family transporter [Pseudovibrio exalbescens]
MELADVEALFLKVLSVVFPVVFVGGAGFFIARLRIPFDVKVVNSIVSNLAMPSLVMSHLAAQHISFAQFSQMMLAALVALCCFMGLGFIFLKVVGFPVRTYLNALTFANVGNVGLPIVYFAFGSTGLSYALAFWVVVVLGLFTVGTWLPQHSITFKRVLTAPNIYGVIIGLTFMAMDWSFPAPLNSALTLLGGACIPLMLLTLGFSIASLNYDMLITGALIAVFHLVVAIFLASGLVQLFGFTGAAKGAFVLEMLMPSSVFAYLMAERYAPETAGHVASVVLFSTLFAMLSLPVALAVLMR